MNTVKNTKTKAIIRIIITGIIFINAILTAKGINPIPFDESVVTEFLTELAGGLALVWAWWKNANITKAAQAGQAIVENAKK